MNNKLRLKEIDFLRGIAIILVLFRHHWLLDIPRNMGWIGVDLFFVLSGFLVSGLLFAEYKKFGDVKPIYFLVRRGFKIYPLFYLSIFITFLYLYYRPENLLNYKGIIIKLLPEIFFLQNYLTPFWVHHWSLAVEEHFYIFLSILIYFLSKYSVLDKQKTFFTIASIIFVFCLSWRVFSCLFYPNDISPTATFTGTHIRIDSLFAGVVIAHFYHFNNTALVSFYHKYKKFLVGLSFLPFLLAAFINFAPHTNNTFSIFVRTIGFTLIYISFSALLIIFLFSRNINKILQKICTPLIYSVICRIGFYSYSIYLFHFYFVFFLVDSYYTEDIVTSRSLSLAAVISFTGYFIGSIMLGVISSYLIEVPFLKIREKIFPRRIN